MRLLHASDIHVGDIHVDKGDPVEAARSTPRSPSASMPSLLVGDIFDHNRIPTEVGQALVDELARLDVPVVVLPGNHDCLVPDAIWSRVTLPPNVHVMTDADGEHVELAELDAPVWGRPHPSYGDLRPLAGLPAAQRPHVAARAGPRPHGAAARGPPSRLPDHARRRSPRPSGTTSPSATGTWPGT